MTENSTSQTYVTSELSANEQLMWHVLYYVLAIIYGILNLFLIMVIPSDPTLRRRVTNWFLWTISVAYLSCAIFVTPFGFKSKIYGIFEPVWALWICQTRPAVMMTAYNIEILLLLSLAVRYFIDFKHLQKDLRLTYWGGFLIIVIVIIVSAGISLPWGYFREILTHRDGNGGSVTVIVTNVMYAVVTIKAWKTIRAFPDAKAELKLLSAVLIKFNLAWLPTMLMFSVKSVDKLTGNQTIPSSISLTLYLSNGIWHDMVGLFNPVIYFIFSKHFRRAYLRFMTCKCGSDRRLEYSWNNDIQLGHASK